MFPLQCTRFCRIKSDASHSYLPAPVVYDFHYIIFFKFPFYADHSHYGVSLRECPKRGGVLCSI